jgi:hypothetical protein
VRRFLGRFLVTWFCFGGILGGRFTLLALLLVDVVVTRRGR